jgi:hypothetical protein
MRLRNWLITFGVCYAAFLGITDLWLSWATADMPQDFWPVFKAEAVGGVFVAWLMALAFWKIIWYMHPEVHHYHRSQQRYYAQKRGGGQEAGDHPGLDPAGFRPAMTGGLKEVQEVLTGHYC